MPERRLFLRSDSETRFILLRPITQVVALTGVATIFAWAIIATSILVMDSIGSGNFREQAKRDQINFLQRLNELSADRDARAAEALAAQARFNTALDQISSIQSELLSSEERRRELEQGIGVIQATLRRTMKEREAARAEAQNLLAELGGTDGAAPEADSPVLNDTVQFLSTALDDTAAERDQIAHDAEHALHHAEELELELRLLEEKNDQIFRQLEDAMTVSVEPLDKMFRQAGLDTDALLNQVRRGYNGQGGPLMPLSLSTKDAEPSLEEERANRLLSQMDHLNLYRIAAEKAPFATPVRNAFRFTSGFGFRRDPKTGGRRMHKGVDFAAKLGTPLFATADGVVTHAGWSSGYGRLVKIQHEFGIETRYAHLSKLNVKVGQRVSRGDNIGAMGASGRVTGVHLHYEVRVGGKAVNPMIYIKAANDVF